MNVVCKFVFLFAAGAFFAGSSASSHTLKTWEDVCKGVDATQPNRFLMCELLRQPPKKSPIVFDAHRAQDGEGICKKILGYANHGKVAKWRNEPTGQFALNWCWD